MTVRALMRGGAAAGPVFLGAALVQGALRPGYRASRHPISSLALGPSGWVQAANFVVAGVLYLGMAVGLARTPHRAVPDGRLGPALVGAAGVGLVGAAAFPTDPVSGYPPGTPALPSSVTRVGVLHNLSSAPVFVGLPVAMAAYALAFRRAGHDGWAGASAASGVAMVASFVAAGAGIRQVPSFVDHAGTWQRVSIASGFGWLTALAIRVLRTLP